MSFMQVFPTKIIYYGHCEEEVLDGILDFSEFRKFYEEAYKPQKNLISIDWYTCSELWENFRNYAFQGVSKNTGRDYICLEWLPVTANDAFLVAHELGHVIRKHEGRQLSISTKSQRWGMTKLVTDLGSMFDDPIINSLLKTTYHFDPAYHYTEIELPDCIKDLSNVSKEPENDVLRLSFIFFYTNQLLRWDTIYNTIALEKWKKYQKFYRSKYKSLAQAGEELYNIVKEIGVDTPDKQRQIFNKISNMYEIDGESIKNILSAK